MLFRYTFPISNYYGDGIFDKHVYFQGDSCPTFDQVKQSLLEEAQIEERLASENGFPCCDEYQQCLNVLELVKDDFPRVSGNCVHMSTSIESNGGFESVVASKIEPIQI